MSAVSPFRAALLDAAARNPASEALRFNEAGVWRRLGWRGAVGAIDRLAAGLVSLGLAPGRAVAIDGALTAKLVLAVAAARAVGARLVAIPLHSSAAERARALDDPAVAVVIGQGRDVVGEWAAIAAQGRRTPIVFDHATAGRRSPSELVVTLDALAAGAAPPDRAGAPDASGGAAAEAALWLEESTDWAGALDAALDAWVGGGRPLALPELLEAADRDRAAARPGRWLVSAARLDAAVARHRERLPAPGGVAHALVARALSGARDPLARLVRGRLRAAFGIAGLGAIEVGDGGAAAVRPETRSFLSALGAGPVGLGGGAASAEPAAAPGSDFAAALADVAR